MDLLVSADAVPLGLTTFWISLCGLFLLSLAGTYWAGWVERHRGLMVLPLIMTALFATLGTANILALARLDARPEPLPTDSIIGSWRKGIATLQLNDDSTLACSHTTASLTPCAREGLTGRWARDGDWLVHFEGYDESHKLTLRVVRFHGVLYLASVSDPSGAKVGQLEWVRGPGPYPVYVRPRRAT